MRNPIEIDRADRTQADLMSWRNRHQSLANIAGFKQTEVSRPFSEEQLHIAQIGRQQQRECRSFRYRLIHIRMDGVFNLNAGSQKLKPTLHRVIVVGSSRASLDPALL